MAENEAASEATTPLAFEESLLRLEAIVRELEEGRIGLEEALARYEEGVALLRQCQGMLRRAEQRIELLAGVDADGNPVVQPFDAEESASLAEKQAAADPAAKGVQRNRRRAASRSTPRTISDNAAIPPPPTDIDVDEEGQLF
jgi:exodeoxyribonuclease VII small subunit